MADKPNRLAREKSPYLLQHKDNPVDWYPWGEEAFAKARREDKPIFLSIGYATCHWCHVMEHESFEDPEVARRLNAAFVCVKVDREERPDVDQTYMRVCQMITGSGGWPLTILLTPEAKPFFAATYIPKEERFGRPGLLDLVPRVQALWANERGRLVESASEITRHLQDAAPRRTGGSLDAAVLDAAAEQLASTYDPVHGGFGGPPKFPTPHQLVFLLRHGDRTRDAETAERVYHTLRAMRKGGIFDHIGFGFHRYATDREWFLPHFEKMLYDQALLVKAYVEAYLRSGDDEFRATAAEVIEYVLRDLAAPEGGFHSAEDADSEGVEGKFYAWTWEELERAIPPAELHWAAPMFGVVPGGNLHDEAHGTPT
ncbi:MAG: thioredoxin domain-containing protein, partial [Euryarchaeota archaeon]|nr:thioredoxin domain-containing protein [Euryarchaeota archaeon]